MKRSTRTVGADRYANDSACWPFPIAEIIAAAATGPLSLALKLNFLENGGIKRSRALLKVRFVAVFFYYLIF